MYVYVIISVSYALRAYKGTVSSTSISWSSAYADCGISGDVHSRPNISKSADGYVWIIFNYYDNNPPATPYDLNYRRSSSVNSLDFGACANVTANINPGNQIILPYSSSSNNMIAIYDRRTETLYYKVYNGSSWSGETTITTSLKNDAGNWYYSAVNDASYTPHLIYVDTSDEVQYTKYSGGAWTSPNALTTDTTSKYVSLSIDSGNDNLYAFYRQGSTWYYRKYNGSSWESQRDTNFSEGTSPVFLTTNFSRDNRRGDEGRIFGIWSNTDNSNSVMFGRIFEVAASVEEMRHGKFFHEGAEQKMTW